MCFNCLRKGHRSLACSNSKSCRKCSKRHHTLLHFERKRNPVERVDKQKNPEAIPECVNLIRVLPGKDYQPVPVGRIAKNIVDCPRSDTRIASIVQQPEHTYQQFVRTSPKGKQQPMTTRIETAFQRAGVCSRTFAPNEGSIMLCCATNTNHRIGTVTKHRHEARTLTRADGTAAINNERVSAVGSCRECSGEPHRRGHHHRLSSLCS